ncbi:hypothetical protein [Roseburia sp. 499]|uniref:hypothetical protein n=1 Tax=Roseburia sp. 499 TaxID=1261634 RepID=UPI000952D8D5|nr:hypothetical protein [Roseburia sp. 499]WVK71396.1 hypothetical protein BIV20_07595 [Roseburia sp. 499]
MRKIKQFLVEISSSAKNMYGTNDKIYMKASPFLMLAFALGVLYFTYALFYNDLKVEAMIEAIYIDVFFSPFYFYC